MVREVSDRIKNFECRFENCIASSSTSSSSTLVTSPHSTRKRERSSTVATGPVSGLAPKVRTRGGLRTRATPGGEGGAETAPSTHRAAAPSTTSAPSFGRGDPEGFDWISDPRVRRQATELTRDRMSLPPGASPASLVGQHIFRIFDGDSLCYGLLAAYVTSRPSLFALALSHLSSPRLGTRPRTSWSCTATATASDWA